ncbi:hypothetical protein [Microbispora triticiradicis]|uniref:hypothetical protein n=1 Tax=Microbispora triticiradicis TaxID=2200763 RepID=UPI001AD7431A|nr:hypothetical protein [Microbispora triticiradicis]MBO4272489.1 hypothetical protein [Microbispora triticiradicis]
MCTAAVTALAGTAHQPRRRPLLTALSALLPTPLRLGLRLTARRRPGGRWRGPPQRRSGLTGRVRRPQVTAAADDAESGWRKIDRRVRS